MHIQTLKLIFYIFKLVENMKLRIFMINWLIEIKEKKLNSSILIDKEIKSQFFYKLANFSSKRIIWQVKPYSLSYQATVLTS